MYIPKSMEITDEQTQINFIKSYPFGVLFSYEAPSMFNRKLDDQEMCATHLPFLFMEDKDGQHKLIAHIAAKNYHGEMLKKNKKCMVVFQGPNSYVSPAWYPEKKVTHKFVPTWDYTAVHVYGEAKIITDREKLLEIVAMISDQQESKRPEGDKYEPKWSISDAPEEYIKALLKNIVGLEIDISKIQAKFKLHQINSPMNVNGLIKGYEEELSNDLGKTMASLTKEYYPKPL
ncbi:uncharacterized protein SCODWIG_02028 [Saccharomycodes ludwigii]|uniref:Transcriptional regulator n=1 Tax=Saccharomycodes ludwigii TaxID=36035 RepID=A0A376B6D8_9ASCO|nr:hypothetical protein SCDLUD_005321 [Saccharomycodes ludwigii]KAH3898974.1 hypothetical protein SCDLUD_005321 [Saccharomycodes ludwigii]SSD60267.1 uncharacterized protein SCODWIG_02028 [Saccharomycodes ludwigii]